MPEYRNLFGPLFPIFGLNTEIYHVTAFWTYFMQWQQISQLTKKFSVLCESKRILLRRTIQFRSSHRRCSAKKVFIEISQNSQESTFGTGVSCEFWEIYKNTFLTERLWATASDSSSDKFEPEIPLSDWSKFCQGNLILHQKKEMEWKKTSFMMKNNKNAKNIYKSIKFMNLSNWLVM